MVETRITYLRSEICSNAPLINHEKVYLPPLHIKLGLKKTFVKAMNQNSAGFMYLKNKLPKINDVKIKEDIFVDLKYKR